MRKQSGYTLIELSIVLVILGIATILIWRFVDFNAQYALSASERASMRSADAAISGFVLSHNRLPCPDTDADGREDCAAGAAVGALPFVSIGMPRGEPGQIRYGVYRDPSTILVEDADLAASKDRMPMLATRGAPALVGYDLFAIERNGIDLCAGLRNGANSAINTNLVHVTSAGGNFNVAYAFAMGGWTDADQAGSLLDQANAGSGAAFEAPSRVTDEQYDDRVVSVGFDRLMGRLGCYGTLAVATHAHANAATWAEITHQAMLDYKIQLDLIVTMAEAKVAAAAAAVALAAAGLAAAGADAALALSETIASLGTLAAVTALAIAAIAASTAATISAGAGVVPAADALNAAQDTVQAFASQQFVLRSANLALQIRANANAADAAGTW